MKKINRIDWGFPDKEVKKAQEFSSIIDENIPEEIKDEERKKNEAAIFEEERKKLSHLSGEKQVKAGGVRGEL